MIDVKINGKVFDGKKGAPLRNIMMDNKVDVYKLQGKLNNCGGAGVCGTCKVKVLDGAKNLSPPSKNEVIMLKGQPTDIRLSCCAKLKGSCSIKSKP
jgi:ferredoxin